MSEIQQEELIPEIKYQRPKFHRRILANLVDLLILAASSILLFTAVRAIVQSTPSYEKDSQTITQIRLDSGLYATNENELVEMMDYIADDSSLTAKMKYDKAELAIDRFIEYAKETIGEEEAAEINESTLSAASDTPCSTGRAIAGCLPCLFASSFTRLKRFLSTLCIFTNCVSPARTISTFFSI